MALSVATWMNVASGVFLILLGLFVATVRPRRRTNVWFAAFTFGFGGGFIVFNLSETPAALYLAGALRVLALVAFIVVARSFPRPIGASDRGAFRVAAGIGVASAALNVGALLQYRSALSATAAFTLQANVFVALFSLMQAALLLWALRFRRAAADDPALARQHALMCAALAIYLGYVAGGGFSGRSTSILSGDPAIVFVSGVNLLMMAVVAAVWLSNVGAAPPALAPVARNVALVTLAAPLAGLAWIVFLDLDGGHGLARTLGVAVLAYAIVRHQLFDIDLKIKWTIRRGTVAAVFVVVFLVAAQVAEQFLSDELGLLIGGVATGLMLFAIAPLQRLAERVANVAMPGVADTPAYRSSKRADAYRFALRMAYADRVLSRDEERGLAALAEELGLSHTEALALRVEAGREVGGPSLGGLAGVAPGAAGGDSVAAKRRAQRGGR